MAFAMPIVLVREFGSGSASHDRALATTERSPST